MSEVTQPQIDVLEMLDDLILHGLSFELVRVISSIGKKTDWLSVSTALLVFFPQFMPVQSEKCIPFL